MTVLTLSFFQITLRIERFIRERKAVPSVLRHGAHCVCIAGHVQVAAAGVT